MSDAPGCRCPELQGDLPPQGPRESQVPLSEQLLAPSTSEILGDKARFFFTALQVTWFDSRDR